MIADETEKDEGALNLRPLEQAGQGWRALALEAKRDCEASQPSHGRCVGEESDDAHVLAARGQVRGSISNDCAGMQAAYRT